MNLAPLMNPLLDWLWRASWQASVLVGLVLLVQALLRRKLTPPWRSAFWWLVLIRLVMPVVPQTPWSLFNYTRLDRMGAVTAPLVSRAIGRRVQDGMDTAFTRPSASAPAAQEEKAMTSASEPGAAASAISATASAPKHSGQPWVLR